MPCLTSLRAVVAILLTCLLATPALSGAWPRGDGNVFLSFHAVQDDLNWAERPSFAAYFEYGLTDQWTLGAKLEYDFQSEEFTEGELFARWSFAPGDGPWQKAVSLTVAGLGDQQHRLIPAFHLGRGFDTRWGNAWTDLTFKADLPLQDGDKALGVVGQLGLKPHDRLMTLFSVDVFASETETYTKLIPAVAWQIRPGKHLHLEWSETVDPVPAGKLSLGLWMEF
ncbi:hypothetical protein [Aliiroseovarius crassostreae]|uniref:hypothetical protein n=1 Tax=Aliiroseovarius crassostreae TaxID=154981 RepID=UPI003C7E4B99